MERLQKGQFMVEMFESGVYEVLVTDIQIGMSAAGVRFFRVSLDLGEFGLSDFIVGQVQGGLPAIERMKEFHRMSKISDCDLAGLIGSSFRIYLTADKTPFLKNK